jgi:hypothetical protein
MAFLSASICAGFTRLSFVKYGSFASKRRKEKRDKGLEPRAKKQEARVVRS